MHPLSADLITIVSGVIIFAASQLIQKIYIDPAQQLKRTIADVTATITFYANTGSKFVIHERQIEARNAFRKAAGALRGDASIIPQYNLWRSLAHLPPYQNIQKAATIFIGAANDVGGDDEIRFSERLHEISTLLGGTYDTPKVNASPPPVTQKNKSSQLRTPISHRNSAPVSELDVTTQPVSTSTDQ